MSRASSPGLLPSAGRATQAAADHQTPSSHSSRNPTSHVPPHKPQEHLQNIPEELPGHSTAGNPEDLPIPLGILTPAYPPTVSQSLEGYPDQATPGPTTDATPPQATAPGAVCSISPRLEDPHLLSSLRSLPSIRTNPHPPSQSGPSISTPSQDTPETEAPLSTAASTTSANARPAAANTERNNPGGSGNDVSASAHVLDVPQLLPSTFGQGVMEGGDARGAAVVDRHAGKEGGGDPAGHEDVHLPGVDASSAAARRLRLRTVEEAVGQWAVSQEAGQDDDSRREEAAFLHLLQHFYVSIILVCRCCDVSVCHMFCRE